MANIAVEESKAQRIQRQQARFRDRGGTFVPSGKNPLADILLARAVTGESPSKAKSVHSKTDRVSQTVSRDHRTAILSPSRGSSNIAWLKSARSGLEKPLSENCDGVPGSSKAAERVMESVSKKKGSKKRKATQLEGVDENEGSKPSRKGKARRPKKSAQDNVTTSKRKARTTAVSVMQKEDPESDDQTLVEAPQKAGSRGKKRKPVVVEDSHDITDNGRSTTTRKQTSRSQNALERLPSSKQVIIEDPHDTSDNDRSITTRKQTSRSQNILEKMLSSKRILENTSKESEGNELEVTREPNHKRRRPSDDDASGKKSKKAASSISKSCNGDEAEIKPKKPAKGKISVSREDAVSEPVVKKRNGRRTPKVESSVGDELDDDVSRPRKRKKAIPVREHQDDRPLKAEDIESKPVQSSKLKENTMRAPSINPKVKPTSRKPSKGPPPDLLERIRAIATNHRPIDDEPDPLDCLS
ncbi:hypothetical protein EDC04DRAFT_1163160 [Pisolithus marmoratus]|nr:hypothetical protein EDC04DRAFT_1163160 [Pisolithus marmoratus]